MRMTFAVLALVVVITAVAVLPAAAQGLEIRCPDGGIAGSLCSSVAPVINLVLQILTVAIGFVLILWLLKILH